MGMHEIAPSLFHLNVIDNIYLSASFLGHLSGERVVDSTQQLAGPLALRKCPWLGSYTGVYFGICIVHCIVFWLFVLSIYIYIW